jgi:hypothetical protein
VEKNKLKVGFMETTYTFWKWKKCRLRLVEEYRIWVWKSKGSYYEFRWINREY